MTSLWRRLRPFVVRLLPLTAVVLATALTYSLYTLGAPGAPHDETIDHRFWGDIEVYLPEGVGPSVVTASIAQTFQDDDTSSDLVLEIEVPKPIPPGKSIAIIQASGNAKPDEVLYISNVEDLRLYAPLEIERIDDDPYQSVFAINLSQATYPSSSDTFAAVVELRGLQRNIWTKENARTLVQTPTIHSAHHCPFLTNQVSKVLPNKMPEWDTKRFQCRPEGSEDRARIRFDRIDPADLKIDVANLPSSGVKPFEWEGKNSVQVRASLLSVTAEANAQRYLFASGVLAGFTGGLIPAAVKAARRREDDDSPDDRATAGSQLDAFPPKATLAAPLTRSGNQNPVIVRWSTAFGLAVGIAFVCRALRNKRR